jgi:TRAP transporter TAXI family solute receptor
MRQDQPRKLVTGLAVVTAIAVVVGVSLTILTDRDRSWQVTIATATPGGTYYRLGDQLARILARLPNQPIEYVTAERSAGTQENIQRLLGAEADLAFVQGPALVSALASDPETRRGVRVLSRLYTDVVQIVVRRGTRIRRIPDLRGRRIFVGPQASGTRLLVTQMLETLGLTEGTYTPDDAGSFAEAADRLIDGRLDVAFFAAGTPTEAVQRALASGRGELLSLDPQARDRLTATEGALALVEVSIPANFYHNQAEPIQTVGADVFLAARTEVPADLAFLVLEALFDNIGDLLLAHPKAQDIRLTRAFDIPPALPLHPGARRFEAETRGALLVATGAVNGKYYHLGRMIQQLLTQRGIPARVVQSDGSLENATLLGSRPTLAIMQYDAALASRFGQPRFVYQVGSGDEFRIPPVSNIRRIAALHREQLHVIVRRETLAGLEARLGGRSITTLSELAKAQAALPRPAASLRVCLGPDNSATQIVSQVILDHHGIGSGRIIPSYLSVPDMVNRLHSGEIDVGFFVSYVPGEAMKTILNDGSIKLLSLGQPERAPMTRNVFEASMIEPRTYGSQKEGEPAIHTISTRAVLVTTEDLPFDVGTITRAVFEGEAFLGVRANMADDLSSLPLHPDAERYYKEAGFLPSKPPIDWLAVTWRTLASLVILIGGYKGLIRWRRDRISNEIARRLLAIPVDEDVPDSVQRLQDLRREIRDRVRRRWWRPGELDKTRWRYLRDLIDQRTKEAKDNLTRALAAEIRAAVPRPDTATAGQRYRLIEHRLWDYFEKGELDVAQRDALCHLLVDSLGEDVTSVSETPDDGS